MHWNKMLLALLLPKGNIRHLNMAYTWVPQFPACMREGGMNSVYYIQLGIIIYVIYIILIKCIVSVCKYAFEFTVTVSEGTAWCSVVQNHIVFPPSFCYSGVLVTLSFQIIWLWAMRHHLTHSSLEIKLVWGSCTEPQLRAYISQWRFCSHWRRLCGVCIITIMSIRLVLWY